MGRINNREMEIKKVSHLAGHNSAVYCISESALPNIIYTGGADQVVIEWDLSGGHQPKIISDVKAIVYSLCFIPEKNYLIIGESKGGIHVLDLKEKREIKFFVQTLLAIFDIKYSPANKCFYSASWDGSISAWSLEDLTLIKNIPLCKEKIRAININSTETLMAIACGDGTIRIFNLQTLEEIQKLDAHQGSTYSVKFHPNGRYLLSGAKDAMLNIYDIKKSCELIKSIPAHNYAIYSIVFSPDEKLFATASRDKTIKIWNADTFEIIKRIDKDKLEGHNNSVNKLLWSRYKDYLISTGDDRMVMVWEFTPE
jgi:WD40 repeat protein